MASPTKFYARNGTLAYSTTAIDWTGTYAANETMTSIAEVKDVTVTLPEREIETVLCLGATAQTTGSNARAAGTSTGVVAGTFQNAMLDIKNVGNWKVEGTAVFIGDEQFNHLITAVTNETPTAGYTRRAIGDLASSTWAQILVGSVRFYLNNGSEGVCIVLTNVAFRDMGNFKKEGNHYEISFSAECLPKDGAIEFTN